MKIKNYHLPGDFQEPFSITVSCVLFLIHLFHVTFQKVINKLIDYNIKRLFLFILLINLIHFFEI